VIDAIRQVLDGRIWVSDHVNAQLLQKLARNGTQSPQSPLDPLSDRELEVFHMIGNGLRLRDIAAKLFLSMKTVEVHREHIKEKLGLKTSAELIRYAVTHTLGTR